MYSFYISVSICVLQMSSGSLSKQCMDTLLRLCPSVQLYWRTMKQAFISCDKERTGKISLQDFRKVVHIGLLLINS